MKHELLKSPDEMQALLGLKRLFLRAALSIAGGMKSGPAETKVAGNEAAQLKSEIAQLEADLGNGASKAA